LVGPCPMSGEVYSKRLMRRRWELKNAPGRMRRVRE